MKTLVNIIVIVLSLLLSPFLELSAQGAPFQSPSAPTKIDPFESSTAPKKAPPTKIIRAKPSAKGDGTENTGQTLPPPKPPPPIPKPLVIPSRFRPIKFKADGSEKYPFKLGGKWEIITIPLEDLEDKIPTLSDGYEPFGVYANKIFLKRKKMPTIPRPVIPPRKP